MTDAALDQQPVDGATDAPGANTPTPAAPSTDTAAPEKAEGTEAETQTEVEADADGLLDDGEEPAAEGEETEEAEERKPLAPWQPPEGQEVNEHAKPHLQALDAIASDEGQRDKIVGLFDTMMKAEVARLAEVSKAAKTETVTALKAELGDGYGAFRDQVDGAFKALPKEFRDQLKGARLANGQLLLSTRGAIDLLHRLGAKPPAPQTQGDRRVTIQKEIDDIDAAMHADVSSLYKPWRGTGQLATDRKLALLRELGNEGPPKASAAETAKEMRKLEDLKVRDPLMYEHGSWPGARSPAERHHQLRTGRGA